MRIVEVVRGLALGGVEVSLSRRLRYTPPQAWTAIVTTRPSLNSLTQEVCSRSDLLIELDTGRWSLRKVTDQIHSLNPDVIVSHAPIESLRLLSSRLPESVPVVAVAHHPESSERAWAKAVIASALKRVNPKAALHIAVSSAAASGSQCAGASRVEVLPLGAELDNAVPDLSPWPSNSRIRLLSLGRFRAFKNLDKLLEGVLLACDYMRAEKAFLAIVGDGPEKERLASAIKRYQLSDVVALIPATKNPAGIFRAADIMVITSSSEGGPITAVEAMIAGCRLLTTRTGLYSELFPAHSQVLPIENSDANSIARALRTSIALGPLSARQRSLNALGSLGWGTAAASARFYQTIEGLLNN